MTEYSFYLRLKKLLSLNSRESDLLEFRENKMANSIFIGNRKFCHFKSSKYTTYICMGTSSEKILNDYSMHFVKTKEPFPIRVDIENIGIINTYAPMWLNLFDDVLTSQNNDTYSCCSKFKECSDALECLNGSKQDALLCKYKRNLESGLVFYGRNSVILNDGRFNKNKIISNKKLMHKASISYVENETEISDVPSLRGNQLYIGFDDIDTITDYVVIDIETTGYSYANDSIIEFAALKVSDGSVVDKLNFLAKPRVKLSDKIIQLTGITPEMVFDKDYFETHALEIYNFIGDNIIIGHNVTFDIDRINYHLFRHGFLTISNDYADTMSIAKEKNLDTHSFSLGNVAFKLGIDVKREHRALDDCFTTMKCYETLKTLPYRTTLSSVATCKNYKLRQKDIIPTDVNINEQLAGKTFVITGELKSMPRREAYLKIKNCGGLCGDSVTRQTNYLVTNSTSMTSKMKKAIEYKDNGQEIEIINESEFLKLLKL